jgi:hypothetical protein
MSVCRLQPIPPPPQHSTASHFAIVHQLVHHRRNELSCVGSLVAFSFWANEENETDIDFLVTLPTLGFQKTKVL